MTKFEADKIYALRGGGIGHILTVIDGRAFGYWEIGPDRGGADWDAETGLYHIHQGRMDLVNPATTYNR